LILDRTCEKCFGGLLEKIRNDARGKEIQKKEDMGNLGKDKYKIH
jgi:hypothetical protein